MTTPALPFRIKANDRLPFIECILGYEGSANLPLANAVAVTFIMRLRGADGRPTGTAVKVRRPGVIVDVAASRVRYHWTSADTDTPGGYVGEWEVAYAPLVVGDPPLPQTFPTDSYVLIDVYADLDGIAGAAT